MTAFLPNDRVCFNGHKDPSSHQEHLIVGRTYIVEQVEVFGRTSRIKLRNKNGSFCSAGFSLIGN